MYESSKREDKPMKRTFLSALIVIGLLTVGFWSGRKSVTFLPTNTQLVDEMNLAMRQLGQTNEINFLREMVRREMQLRSTGDASRRYGEQPCRTAD
jgi:hypothetical protein